MERTERGPCSMGSLTTAVASGRVTWRTRSDERERAGKRRPGASAAIVSEGSKGGVRKGGLSYVGVCVCVSLVQSQNVTSRFRPSHVHYYRKEA